jgi:hypothetical protein
MRELIKLTVGEDYHLNHSKGHIVYGGMPNGESYSIVVKQADDKGSYAWNLFYPHSHKDITIDGVELFVDYVTPEEIGLRVPERAVD